MASYQTTIRNGCYDKIVAAKPSLVITDFEVDKTYFPTYDLTEIGDTPKVAVTAMGMGSERNRQYRNVAIKTLDLGVIVHVLKRISDKTTVTELDTLVELVEQLMNTLEDDELVAGETFQWGLTEPIKDENGMILDYEALSESEVFQAVFIMHYTYILQ